MGQPGRTVSLAYTVAHREFQMSGRGHCNTISEAATSSHRTRSYTILRTGHTIRRSGVALRQTSSALSGHENKSIRPLLSAFLFSFSSSLPEKKNRLCSPHIPSMSCSHPLLGNKRRALMYRGLLPGLPRGGDPFHHFQSSARLSLLFHEIHKHPHRSFYQNTNSIMVCKSNSHFSPPSAF